MKTLLATIVLALALLVPGTAAAAPGEIVSYPLPAGSEPEGIAAGADGNLWVAERGSNSIARVTPGGAVTEYALPAPPSASMPTAQPSQIAAGPDGNLWFTEQGPGAIGRITPAGAVTEFPVCDYCRPWGITAGPEGAMWFTLSAAEGVGRITSAGQVTRFPLAVAPNTPAMIATGSDGNLWIADKGLVKEEPTIGQIVRLTPAGQASAFKVPTPVENFRPTAIAAGPDGALWFAGSGTGVGRIDTAGSSFTEFPLPLFGEIDTMVAGPDGNIWFSNSGPAAADGSIDRITLDGHLTTYAVPYGARGITVGPEGDIWFTEWAEHRVGRIAPGSPGLEVTSQRAGVHGRWARVPLFCSGGSPGSRCAGTLILRAAVHVRSGGHRETRRVAVGSARYSVIDGSPGAAQVKLDPKRLKRFRRGDEVRVQALARGSAGVGTTRGFALLIPGR